MAEKFHYKRKGTTNGRNKQREMREKSLMNHLPHNYILFLTEEFE